ncbi:hypothetical protein F5Y05DRAFT_408982 [Hypoxylon sp. FL0543]|nr:hypothetical protein F5Y05DRAFT_408982 [Hypoxylon sp. FL0543]
MEAQSQPPTASPGTGSGSGSDPSPTPAKTPSPVNPQPDSATHYPNGLPKSINGLKGDGVNGARSQSPTAERQAAATSIPSAAAPSPAASTPVPTRAAPASAPTPTLPSIAAAPLKPPVMPATSVSQPSQPTQLHQRLQGQPSSSSHQKIAIVDPPGTLPRQRSGQYSSPLQSFPSPTIGYNLEDRKYRDDVLRLTHATQQSVPQAVRRVVRDNWEKCLLGSEFHQLFILKAVITRVNAVWIRKFINEIGGKMVSTSKHELMAHFAASDLDEVANDILDKASDSFLDQALERRLKTIDARSLINALARAERLGYEHNDISEAQKERVLPFNPTPSLNPTPRPAPDPGSKPQWPPNTTYQCKICWRIFDSFEPFNYHVQKQICSKQPPDMAGFPFSCNNCGAGFTTKVGQQYHLANRVCGHHGTMPATPKAPANSGSPIAPPSSTNSPIQAPAPSHYRYPNPSHQTATPVQPSQTAVRTPNSQPKDQHDPYGHLHPTTRMKLDEELKAAEITYAARFKEAEAIEDPALRQSKLDGLHNSFSTKQSIIRKKYGVRLRNRRTKAEIDNEKQRMGLKRGSPGQPDGTPSVKRARTDDGPSHLGSQVRPQVPGSGASEPRSHLAVSDMSAGLGGSSATATTTDPTQPSSTSSQSVPSQHQELAQNSLAALQKKKGYRVSTHVTQPTEVSPSDSTMEGSTPQRSNSAAEPIVVDDDDSSDSDSDEDIPASLPPRKASVTPSKGSYIG